MNKDYLKTQKLGWTWREKEAFPYHSTKRSNFFYVYCGKVHVDDVNWTASVIKALEYYRGEAELELNPDSKVEIYAVREKRFDDWKQGAFREYNINYTAKT